MRIIFRILLTSSALSPFVVLFFVNNEILICNFLPTYVNYFFYFLMPFVLSYINIPISKRLSSDNLEKIKFVEPANHYFLNNYLALFFIALNVSNGGVFILCLSMIILFTASSRVTYFNPILVLFGYNFYYLHLANDSKVMLITKQKVKSPLDIGGDVAYNRINDYTFIG